MNLDIVSLNGNVINRHRSNFNTSCLFCPSIVESRHHVLIDCPHFDHFRLSLISSLNLEDYTFSFPLVLGELPLDIPTDQRFAILNLCGTFLTNIAADRHVS